MKQGVFISWAPFSRRTETLARRFDLEVRFVSTPWPKRPLVAPLKYAWQAVVTARVLGGMQVRELWVMDPPSPLVALVGAIARHRGVPLVVDMHTVAFRAREWKVLRCLELKSLRSAAAVVVTNESLATEVTRWGARALVVPDPIPEPPSRTQSPAEADLVTVVATYSRDEPLHLLPDIARQMPEVRFAVTGTPRGDRSEWPPNLVATGFLSDQDYWMQLRRSAVVVVLTTRPDTLLSGGYEALAVARPLVTSDHEVLRQYYGDAAVYASSTVSSLVAAIRESVATGEALSAKLVALRMERTAQWNEVAATLRRELGRPE